MKRTAGKMNTEKTTLKKQQKTVKDGARQTEEPYSVQLNGTNSAGTFSKAPPWPTPQLKNEKMFLLPKPLGTEDILIVKMETLDQPGILRVGLVTGYNTPDYSNLACQLELTFPPQYPDNLTITTVQNGQATNVFSDKAVDYYEDTNLSVSFRMRANGFMNIGIGQSHLHTMQLQHDVESIRFLTINGDINRVRGLEFEFGE